MKTEIFRYTLTDALAHGYAHAEREIRQTERKCLTLGAKTAHEKKVRKAAIGSVAGQRIEAAFFWICSPLVLGCILFWLVAP